MFKNTAAGKKMESDFQVTDFEPKTVESFLNYLYKDELDQTSEIDAMDLARLAKFLDFDSLKTAASEFVVSNLTVDNVVK